MPDFNIFSSNPACTFNTLRRVGAKWIASKEHAVYRYTAKVQMQPNKILTTPRDHP